MSRSTRNVSLVVAVAATVAAIGAAGYVGYSQTIYKRRRSRLKEEVNNIISHSSSAVDSAAKQDHDNVDVDVDQRYHHHQGSLPQQFDENLIQEFLARNYAFFGVESMRAVRKGTVVVVGCGGVGSWAALMLLRRYLPFSFSPSSLPSSPSFSHPAHVRFCFSLTRGFLTLNGFP